MSNDSAALLADLQKRLNDLVETARKEGREDALAEVRSLVGGAVAKRGPGRPPKAAKAGKPKRKKKRKNPWATMTPKQKADRVRKMLAGRGLKPKAERKPVAKAAAKPKKKRKNSWEGLTPEQRLKRVNAMRKGRGLPLKRKL